MSNNKFKILVIEDEAKIRSFVNAVLETNGYQTILAETYKEGVMMFGANVPDLIILDLGLPDRDGLEFIAYIRERSSIPVIVLSARSSEQDKVTALDLGANDYITKPFGTAELVARVRVAIRNRKYTTDEDTAPRKMFCLKDLKIDYDKRKVTIGEEEVSLTQIEYNILCFMSEHTGKMLTYAAIIKAVWGSADSGSIKKLQVNIANIRKKLGSRPGSNHYIINELGVGYRMPDE